MRTTRGTCVVAEQVRVRRRGAYLWRGRVNSLLARYWESGRLRIGLPDAQVRVGPREVPGFGDRNGDAAPDEANPNNSRRSIDAESAVGRLNDSRPKNGERAHEDAQKRLEDGTVHHKDQCGTPSSMDAEELVQDEEELVNGFFNARRDVAKFAVRRTRRRIRRRAGWVDRRTRACGAS